MTHGRGGEDDAGFRPRDFGRKVREGSLLPSKAAAGEECVIREEGSRATVSEEAPRLDLSSEWCVAEVQLPSRPVRCSSFFDLSVNLSLDRETTKWKKTSCAKALAVRTPSSGFRYVEADVHANN